MSNEGRCGGRRRGHDRTRHRKEASRKKIPCVFSDLKEQKHLKRKRTSNTCFHERRGKSSLNAHSTTHNHVLCTDTRGSQASLQDRTGDLMGNMPVAGMIHSNNPRNKKRIYHIDKRKEDHTRRARFTPFPGQLPMRQTKPSIASQLRRFRSLPSSHFEHPTAHHYHYFDFFFFSSSVIV